jgi:acyl-CoA thioester hydrolase
MTQLGAAGRSRSANSPPLGPARTHGVAFVGHRVEIDFLQPARLNDTLDVTVEAVERGRSRHATTQACRCEGIALTNAQVTLACVETAHWRPTRIPKPLQDALDSTG